MQATDMRQMTDDELTALVLRQKRELLNLRFRKASGETGDTSRFQRARQEVARAMTVLAERRDGAVPAGSDANS